MSNIPQNDVPRKQCGTCKRSFPSTPEFFVRDKNRKDGLHPQCKTCRKAVNEKKAYDANISESTPKTCNQCKNSYPSTLEFFSKNKRQKDGLTPRCKICNKANLEEWQKKNKDRKHEMDKQYYLNNRENVLANAKNYRQSHRQKVYEGQRRYVQSHMDKVNAYKGRYRKTERGRIAARAGCHRRRARQLMARGNYTAKQLRDQLLRQKSTCYYCKMKLDKSWHADHVVPLSRGGTNDISNLVIACASCNFRKSDKLPHEWPEGGRLF